VTAELTRAELRELLEPFIAAGLIAELDDRRLAIVDPDLRAAVAGDTEAAKA
jgi:hypothetical protein